MITVSELLVNGCPEIHLTCSTHGLVRTIDMREIAEMQFSSYRVDPYLKRRRPEYNCDQCEQEIKQATFDVAQADRDGLPIMAGAE